MCVLKVIFGKVRQPKNMEKCVLYIVRPGKRPSTFLIMVLLAGWPDLLVLEHFK